MKTLDLKMNNIVLIKDEKGHYKKLERLFLERKLGSIKTSDDFIKEVNLNKKDSSNTFIIPYEIFHENENESLANLKKINPNSPVICLIDSDIYLSNEKYLDKLGIADFIFTPLLIPQIVSSLKSSQLKFQINKNSFDMDEKVEKSNQASSSKSQFLANMSHEIRTPLNAIAGFSRTILKRIEDIELPDELVQYMVNIKISADGLSGLLNNILDFSKIEAGKIEIDEEKVNMKEFLNQIGASLQYSVEDKNLNFSYSMADDVSNLILVDRNKLRQILINLASNAVKFTPSGKKVEIRGFKENGKLLFHVKDEGIGIAQDKIGTIFELFEQEHGRIKKNFGGTGLGLGISRQLAQLLGGDIKVISEKGNGSNFIVDINLKELEETEEANNEEDDNHKFHPDGLVLLVEDNPMNQAAVEPFFEEIGVRLEMASTGAEAIAMTLRLKPNLILMDMHMPDHDGLEVTKWIRENRDICDIPVVAQSADAFAETKEEAQKLGIKDYITKPIEFEKLVEILKEYLPKG